MKKRSLSQFNQTILFAFLLLGIILPQLSGQQSFFVPMNPPKAFYKIEARLDVDNKMIEGTETITFKNTSSQPLSIIAIYVSPIIKMPIEVSLKGYPLKSINKEKGLPSRAPLFYKLPDPLKPGKKIKLDITFSVSLRGDLKVIRLLI